jgi:hypothetical protein
MTDVSVPCGHCGKAIRFGFDQCPECRAVVSRELKIALGERLEATSSEYRTMRNRLREVAILLVVFGALRVVLAIFLYASARDALDESMVAGARLALAVDIVAGCGLIVAARFAAEHPRRVAVSVLVGWLILQILVALSSPLMFLRGLLGRLIWTLALARGVAAAGRAEALHRELTASSHNASLAPAGPG